MLEFDLSKIKDKDVREAIQRLRDQFRELPFLRGDWMFFEVSFDTVGYNIKYRHGLGFQPKDLIQTFASEDAPVIWNYSLFDKTFLDVDVLTPCTVRFFAGRFTP